MIPRLLLIATEFAPALPEADQLDQQIAWALNHQMHPIIVLGTKGDELLRRHQRLADCELVFDPNEHLGFVSALKAGLQAAPAPLYFCATQAAPIHRLGWQHFIAETDTRLAQPYHLLSEAPERSQVPFFPGLITRQGGLLLGNLPAQTDLIQERRVLINLGSGS